jgi:4-hydroxybenzoate polyprenyltransferase
MDIDWGGLKIIGFFGLIMAIVAYDIIKTRREIAADKRAARRAIAIAEPEK